MRDGINITGKNVRDITAAEQKVLKLIRRFNDPDREHMLRGIFKETDSPNEIRAKERQVETKISQALSELVSLRTAVSRLRTRRGMSCQALCPNSSSVNGSQLWLLRSL